MTANTSTRDVQSFLTNVGSGSIGVGRWMNGNFHFRSMAPRPRLKGPLLRIAAWKARKLERGLALPLLS
jgi:hypothetical protein